MSDDSSCPIQVCGGLWYESGPLQNLRRLVKTASEVGEIEHNLGPVENLVVMSLLSLSIKSADETSVGRS